MNIQEIKEKAEALAAEIAKNPQKLKEFTDNPVPVVEGLVGMDLPDDQVKRIVDLIKAKVLADKTGNVLGALGGLLGKK